MKKIKKRIFEIIEVAKDNDTPSRIFDISIISLIFLNVIFVVANTFDVSPAFKVVSIYVELVSIIIFTIEYLLRIWTADFLYPHLNPYKARIKYIFSFMALVDLFSILPFYLPFIITIDLRVLRMLRIIKLFRIFKINRYTKALTTISAVFKRKKNQLISSIFVVFMMMIIASVMMYSAEHDAQPDIFKNAFSALWWAITSITTVGYGDIYPITILGKILGSIISILGIGLFAVPTGIISAGFMENIESSKRNIKKNKNKDSSDKSDEKIYCPYCGKKLK